MAIVHRRHPDAGGDLTADLFPDVSSCVFCDGSEASGFWMTSRGALGVCPRCAESELVALLVDAVVGEDPPLPVLHQRLESTLQRVKAAYWRAGMVATSRAAQDQNRRQAHLSPHRNGKSGKN